MFKEIRQNLKESEEDYETNREEIIKDAAEYIFEDTGDDYDSELIDYEAFTNEYMDINKRDFAKAQKLAQKALDNFAANNYYSDDARKRLLELNDNHTIWELETPENDAINRSEEAWWLWDNIVTSACKQFEEETGEELGGYGRSGRHMCVEPTFENCLRFDELQEVQERLEKEAVEEFNRTIKEEWGEGLDESEEGKTRAEKVVSSFSANPTKGDFYKALNEISRLENDNKINKDEYDEYIKKIQDAYNNRPR